MFDPGAKGVGEPASHLLVRRCRAHGRLLMERTTWWWWWWWRWLEIAMNQPTYVLLSTLSGQRSSIGSAVPHEMRRLFEECVVHKVPDLMLFFSTYTHTKRNQTNGSKYSSTSTFLNFPLQYSLWAMPCNSSFPPHTHTQIAEPQQTTSFSLIPQCPRFSLPFLRWYTTCSLLAPAWGIQKAE